MATATVTPDQDVIHAEIFIAAPPERVFEAITDPAQMPRWWGQEGLYRTTQWKADLRPGGKWSSTGVSADGKPFGVEGEYLEVNPPRRLVHTWIASWTGSLKTVVHWELEAQNVDGRPSNAAKKSGAGTLLKLRHEGFASTSGAADNHANGWKRVMGWLTAYVERGETVNMRK